MVPPAMTTRALLRAAGLLTWGFAGLPAARSILREESCSTIGEAAVVIGWAAAFVVFGIAFFRATRNDADGSRFIVRLVAVQTAAALVMNVLLCTGFEAALLVVVSVQLGVTFALRLRRGLAWLAAQTVVLFFLASHHMGVEKSVKFAIAVIGLEIFAFVVAAMAGREAAARRELEAAREELARATRDGERLRIAREMHDLLGHDMVALHLELETARHLADGRAREAVERAQGIGKTLLEDLRKAVSSMRSETASTPSVDVTADVRRIVEKVQQPKVHLDAPATLDVGDRERATALVRCVQEIVTNAIKHAEAQNVWITLARNEDRIELAAHDDGRGSGSLTPGNGLTGMRERVTALGGELDLVTDAGAGFRVRAVLPVATSEARA